MVLRLRARMRDAEACHTPLPPHPQTATAAQRETGVIFCCTQGPHHPMYTVPTLVHTVNIGKLRHLTPPLRTSTPMRRLLAPPSPTRTQAPPLCGYRDNWRLRSVCNGSAD